MELNTDNLEQLRSLHSQAILAAKETLQNDHSTWEDYKLPENQIIIEKYGVGFVERFCNISADLGSRCPWKPHYKGEPVDDPTIQAIADSIKPAHTSQQQMRRHSLYLQSKLGLHAVTRTDTRWGRYWEVHHPSTIKKPKDWGIIDTHVAVQTHPTDRTRDEHYPIENVTRHCIPDMLHPRHPHTDVSRVIKEILLYCVTMDALQAVAHEKSQVSSMVQFEPDTLPGTKQTSKEGRNPATALVEQYIEFNRRAVTEKGPASSMPWPTAFNGKITVHQIGESLTPEHIETLKSIVARAAEDLPAPKQWLTEGEGAAANHWGDAQMARGVLTERVFPEQQKNDHFWTAQIFQPLLTEKGVASARDWTLVSDTACIETKPDNGNQILELWKCGATTREAAAAANDVELMPLPDGVTEYDHLLTMAGGAATRETPADPTAVPDMPEMSDLTRDMLSL